MSVRFLLAAAVALAACQPTFNWRQVRAEPTPLQALMPCKPEQALRRVAMTEAGVDLHLMRCEAGGATFALAWARLAPTDDRAAVLARWHAASLASWQAAAAGAHPAPPAVWRGQGRDHRGQPLQLGATYRVQGDWVYQALVAAPRLPAEALDTYFGALQP